MFESFVNSERCKTNLGMFVTVLRLRALLIQKDVKLNMTGLLLCQCLRALLIQKDVKLSFPFLSL